MQRQLLADSLTIILALLFSVLFWHEKMGLNILLFTLPLVGGTLWLKPEIHLARSVQITVVGTLLAAIFIVWHNSLWSKFTYVMSLTAFIGFSQGRTLRFLWFGGALAIISALETPVKLFRKLQDGVGGGASWFKPIRFLKVSVIPVVFFCCFLAFTI